MLEHVLDDVDLVLVMSVDPGFGGQQFIEATVAKVAPWQTRSVTAGHHPGRRWHQRPDAEQVRR